MRISRLIYFAMTGLIVGGCASSDPEPPPTQVQGMVVSDGIDDPDREFTDEEVALFASTYVEVTAAQQRYDMEMLEAEDEERERLNRQSQIHAEEIIYEHGMTPEEFNAIAVRLPLDDDLRERVRMAIQQRDQERIRKTQDLLESQ